MPKLPNIWWPASQKNYWERTIFRSGGILGKNSPALIPMCVFKQDYHFSTSVISLHKNLPTETSMNFRNQFRVVQISTTLFTLHDFVLQFCQLVSGRCPYFVILVPFPQRILSSAKSTTLLLLLFKFVSFKEFSIHLISNFVLLHAQFSSYYLFLSIARLAPWNHIFLASPHKERKSPSPPPSPTRTKPG